MSTSQDYRRAAEDLMFEAVETHDGRPGDTNLARAQVYATLAESAAISEQTAVLSAEARRQIAEEIAAEIERVVVSGDFPRPKYERGGFLNDAMWAAQIARQVGEAR